MTQNNTTTRPPLSAWQTELIRFTAFPSPSMNVTKQNWWEELMSEPPTTQKREPRTFVHSDDGPYKHGRLILNVSPLRIDWVYAAVQPESDADVAKLATLGSYEESLGDFLNLISDWFSTQPLNLARMAFGGVWLQEVETPSQGYALLSDHYLPFRLDVNNISDFLYRINRPMQSKTDVSELIVNRLSTWNVATIQNFAIMSSGGHAVQEKVNNPLHMIRLELDINTSADFPGNLPSEKLDDIFHELSDLSSEIAKNGDIR